MPFPGTVQIPIQFSGGLNSKIAEFTLDQPYLQSLQNGIYNQFGQLDKRTGFTSISSDIQGGGNISKGACLTTFNEELLLMDGTSIFSYQNEENVWINRGPVFSTTNSQIRVLNTKVATQSNPDATSIDNLTIYAWEDNRTFPVSQNGIRYSIVNNVTNTSIVSDQLVYAFGTRPKVISDGTQFYIIYNASADTILYNTVPIAAPNTVTSTFNFVCTDGQPSTATQPTVPYDAVIFNGELLVAYASTTGIKLTHDYGTHVLTHDTSVNTIGMCLDSYNNVWVSYSDNINTYVGAWFYDPDPSPPLHPGFFQLMAPIVINRFVTEASVNIAIIEDINLGSVNVTTEIAQSGNNNFINNYIVSSDGYSNFIGQVRSVGLASKPFKYNGNIFINTIWQSNLQATYFTQCLTQGAQFKSAVAQQQAANNAAIATSFAIISKHSPQNGGTYRTNSLLSQADPLTLDSFVFAGQRKGAFTSYQNAATVNLGVAGYSIIFDTASAFNNVSANNNLHIVGGIKKIYDGISCVEDNFNLFPENAQGFGANVTNVTAIPASGGIDGYNQLNSDGYIWEGINYSSVGNLTYNVLTQPNQYQWIIVYEWTDNYGQVQRSGPSVPFTAVTSQTGQGAILIGPMLRLTEKIAPRSSVIISIYRTQDSLPIFYKVTNDNNPLVNDPTADYWFFVDTLSDLDIAANENLYTGSQLGNIAPPPCSLISLNQQRLMINSTEDTGVLWFSQNKFEQDQYNTLALDWNTSFIEGVNSRFGNDITAIGLLDSTLAIFKETSIFILSGDGPNALNTSGQFNDAALLVSDTGCSNQNSLVFITQTPSLPGGLLFKSAKGIYLLGRDETLTYIGAPVEQYNNLTITSASLLAKSNQVVFTTLEGTALVYNYFFNAWSTWQNLPAISACVWQDQLCILKPNGTVMIQDGTGTIFVDTHENGIKTPISMTIKTPWINMNQQQQSYQAVFNCLLLGTLQGPHTLQMQVAYDYNQSIVASALINSTVASNRWGSLPNWGSNGAWGDTGLFSNYQFQINFNNTRCQSIQLTISDVNNPTYSQAFSLNGLVLEALPLPGSMRLPTSNLAGAQ